MPTWRICRQAHQDPGGEGARLNGGRWNSEGVAAVYTASSLALAALEYLVHVDIEDVPGDLVAMAIEVPGDAGHSRSMPDRGVALRRLRLDPHDPLIRWPGSGHAVGVDWWKAVLYSVTH